MTAPVTLLPVNAGVAITWYIFSDSVRSVSLRLPARASSTALRNASLRFRTSTVRLSMIIKPSLIFSVISENSFRLRVSSAIC